LADEALDMHGRLVGEMLGKGEKARDEGFRRRGKAINEKVGLYASVGKALVLARETGENGDIFKIDVEGPTVERQLTDTRAFEFAPDWQPFPAAPATP
jgi:hypothetical protein